jgi:hypothetical protein
MSASLEKLLHAIGSLTTWRAALTFISGVTTLRGMMLLYDVLGGGHGGSLGYLAFLIPFGLAGSLHAAIYWALGRWASLGRWKYLLVAVQLQALAVLASYGTHWTGMRGEGVTIEGFEASQTGVVRALRAFDQSDEFVATSMATLAQHSEEQAKIEATRGGSCGVNAGVGKGPRYDLRMDDSATFSDFNKRKGERHSQVRVLVGRVEVMIAKSADEALANRVELRRIVDSAKSLETTRLFRS